MPIQKVIKINHLSMLGAGSDLALGAISYPLIIFSIILLLFASSFKGMLATTMPSRVAAGEKSEV
jgi:hypothetical protein